MGARMCISDVSLKSGPTGLCRPLVTGSGTVPQRLESLFHPFCMWWRLRSQKAAEMGWENFSLSFYFFLIVIKYA